MRRLATPLTALIALLVLTGVLWCALLLAAPLRPPHAGTGGSAVRAYRPFQELDQNDLGATLTCISNKAGTIEPPFLAAPIPTMVPVTAVNPPPTGSSSYGYGP